MLMNVVVMTVAPVVLDALLALSVVSFALIKKIRKTIASVNAQNSNVVEEPRRNTIGRRIKKMMKLL